MRCRAESTTFAAAMLELDVPTGSTTRLRYSVPNVPTGVTSATLRFNTWDADHPGEEGRIYVNGRGPFALPATAGYDNRMNTASVDVTSAVVAGTNTVEFGAGSLSPRTYYRIGAVALDTVANTFACSSAPPPPPPPPPPVGRAVERTVGYRAATYTGRRNWVVRCMGYAYTARGTDHVGEDCDGLFDPDGTVRGTATFRFPAVVSATYDVIITSRHTSNRNPAGALFVVNGERGTIDQNDDRGGINTVTDVWGRRALSGDVTVVLDSSVNSGSDSVAAVTLRPVP